MKIHTMSVVVGSKACNAKCPYCVSKTTPDNCMSDKTVEINWRNFRIACRLADKAGVNTIMLTGKGEPTLYPLTINQYLNDMMVNNYNFPFIELQTNGITIGNGKVKDKDLQSWYDRGLTTISISMVHFNSGWNRYIYQPHIKDDEGYMDIVKTIQRIKKFGFTVRLSCIMLKGYIDNTEYLEKLIEFCKLNGVKQLTIRPMTAPDNNENDVTKWIGEHHLTDEQVKAIDFYLHTKGTPVLELAHGAVVYDVNGQNVCWTNCLTTNKSAEDMRQIIFFPDGTISYDWKYAGAVLL